MSNFSQYSTGLDIRFLEGMAVFQTKILKIFRTAKNDFLKLNFCPMEFLLKILTENDFSALINPSKFQKNRKHLLKEKHHNSLPRKIVKKAKNAKIPFSSLYNHLFLEK